MRFDYTDPRDDDRRRLEALDWQDRELYEAERRFRHGPARFRCTNCGSKSKAPWCQLCSPRAAA